MIMKNSKFLVFSKLAMMLLILGSYSCTNGGLINTKGIAEDKNADNMSTREDKKNAQFLVNAAEISRNEIRYGQMGKDKGSQTHIKVLGTMVKSDHEILLAEVTALAKVKNVALPTAQTVRGVRTYERLNQVMGIDFGKEYSKVLIAEHREAIKIFEETSQTSEDADVRSWASKSLPLLRSHLKQSLECEQECLKLLSDK